MICVKSVAVAGALLAGSIGLATAADLSYKARPLAPVAPVTDWSGWFIGVNGSGNWGKSDWTFPAATSTAPGFSQAYVGLHGGMNLQLPALGGLVLGTESSFNAATGDYREGAACPNAGFTCQARIGNYFTSGARLGFAWNQLMIYGSGGFAAGQVQTTGRIDATGAPINPANAWHTGYYLGAGLDYQVYKTAGTSMILGLEYQHVDLGRATHTVLTAPADTREVRVSSDVIKAKLTVKLDGPHWFR